MENAMKKKFDLRKIFKEVVKCLEEAKDVTEKEVTGSKRCYGKRSHRRKVSHVKLLSRNFEEETISYKNFRR